MNYFLRLFGNNFGPVQTERRQTESLHIGPPCKLHRWTKSRHAHILKSGAHEFEGLSPIAWPFKAWCYTEVRATPIPILHIFYTRKCTFWVLEAHDRVFVYTVWACLKRMVVALAFLNLTQLTYQKKDECA